MLSEGEWSSLSGICSTEEADFMAQLFGNCPNDQLPSSFNIRLPNFWTSHDQPSLNVGGLSNQVPVYNSSDETNNSMYVFSQESTDNSGGSGIHFPHFHATLLTNNSVEDKMSYPSHQVPPNNVIEAVAIDFLNKEVCNESMESDENMPESDLHGKVLQLRREYDQMQVREQDHKMDSSSESSKKRGRLPAHNVPKSKRSVKPKKNMTSIADDEIGNKENKSNVLHRHSSFSCCSEDESNVSNYELYGLASSDNSKEVVPVKSNGKSRASRGSATDPQSLYARKRRERINERLRILQSLVPNGTKVEISTMLEEAVQYVKFLQLQIKLLSSDDLWMYSPIAYNRMDLGLDLKIGTPNS